MEDTIFLHPLRVLFGLATMTVVNCLFLELIPVYWVGLVTILLLDIFLWELAGKKYDLYAASVSFFGIAGGLTWVVYWIYDLIINAHTVSFQEGILMYYVILITLGLWCCGRYFLKKYKLKSTEV